jgi:hypothetical protein
MAGFRVMSYSPETATIRLLIRQPTAELAATSLTVTWNNGDWKLQPSSDGQLYGTVAAVPNADGFVMWSL